MQEEWKEGCTQLEYIGDITRAELAKHVDKTDRWVVIDGFVYNITQYLFAHPGGARCFMNDSQDVTSSFHRFHPGMDTSVVEKLKIGKLVD
jgi:cytochrome b involved in lipid metabolism